MFDMQPSPCDYGTSMVKFQDLLVSQAKLKILLAHTVTVQKGP